MKNNKSLIVISIVLAILLLAALAVIFIWIPRNSEKTSDNTNTEVTQDEASKVEDTSKEDTDNTKNDSTVQKFSNNYMSIDIPNGWKYTEVNDSVNIEKDGYILYINPNFNQASGVDGARFSEISQGSPSADLVMLVQPNDPCGTTTTENIVLGYERKDLYISKGDASEACGAPTDSQTRWYFSYAIKDDGYVNYFDKTNPTTSYVITMSYQASSVDKLPVKGSSTLNNMLKEMSDILGSLVLKN